MVGSTKKERSPNVAASNGSAISQVNFKKPRTGVGASFADSRIHTVLVQSPPHTVAFDLRQLLVADREDATLTCQTTGRTYLHLAMEHHEKFRLPAALPTVYQLTYMGADLNAQDTEGETALHKVARMDEGAAKILVALMRNGADVSKVNKHGKTAEQIMLEVKAEGWETMHMWFRKFTPGLCALVLERGGTKEVPLESVERLLKSWCKVRIFNAKSQCNLQTLTHLRAKDSALAKTLEKYAWTNEFVHATLAGLPECMKLVIKDAKSAKKKVDVDTVDHSYQFSPADPLVPQPLVAAAWEQGNYEVIDYLMTLDPDVCVGFSNEDPQVNYPKPLFYQTLLGKPRVQDLRIMLRVVECGDLRCKTDICTSFLHECVKHSLPPLFMRKLFALEVDVADREVMGKTARDLGVEMGLRDHVQELDRAVGDMVRDGDVKRLEKLAYNSYDLDIVRVAPPGGPDGITGGELLTLLQYARAIKSKKMVLFFTEQLPVILKRKADLWALLEAEDLPSLTKFMSAKENKGALLSRDVCGRSILLVALIKMNKPMIKAVVKKIPKLVETFDNFMFSALHYAFLLFEEDNEIPNFLISNGASTEWCCVRGKAPLNYRKGVLPNNEFYMFQHVVKDYSLTLFLSRTNFANTLSEAIQAGDMGTVKRLIEDLKPYSAISKFSHVLFECVETQQTDIAVYLIEQGCLVEIEKQYDECSDENPMCAMMECFHPKVSLKEKATSSGLTAVVKAIDSRISTAMPIAGELEVTKL